MNSNIPFETAFQFLEMAYMGSVMLLLLTSNFCLGVIESIEGASR